MQHNAPGLIEKDFAGELFDPQYLRHEGEVRPVSKGEPNGLESTENRGSAGRHGNQHVYVRYPQVSGSNTYVQRRWTSGPDKFPIVGSCLLPGSTSFRL